MNVGNIKERYRDASIHVQKNLNKSEGKAALEINRWKLYGYHKQVSEGDCTHSLPDTQSATLKNKWSAWMQCKGISQENAMEAFISIVKDIDPDYKFRGGGGAKEKSLGKSQSAPVSSKPSDRNAVSMKGFMRKKSAWKKSWNERYFMLQNGQLSSYLKQGDSDTRAVLVVEGCDIMKHTDIVMIDSAPFYGLTLSHAALGTSWVLMCAKEEDRDTWIACLQEARGMPNANLLSAVAGRGKVDNTSNISNAGSSVAAATSISAGGNGAAGSASSSASAATSLATGSGEAGGNTSSATASNNVLGSAVANLPAHILQPLENCVTELLQHAAAKTGELGWEQIFVKDGLTASRKPGDTMMVKGVAVLPYSVKDLYTVISDIGKVQLINPQVDKAAKLKTFNYCSSSNHWLFKQVWPTSARDMINFTHWRLLPDGKLVIATFNCEELHESGPDAHPPPRGAVRANLLMGGYVLDPNVANGTTTVTYVVSSDLRGRIPDSVSNHVARNQPLIVLAIAKQIEAWPPSQRSSAKEYGLTNAKIIDINKTQKAALYGQWHAPITNAGGVNVVGTDKDEDVKYYKEKENQEGDWLPSHHSRTILIPLVLPFLLVYCMEHRLLGFLIGLIVSLPYVHKRLLQGEPMNVEDKYRNNIEFGNALPRGRIIVQFAVDLGKLLRYVEGKREQYSLDISITHVVAKAAANALEAFPALNGRLIGQQFYRSIGKDIDISISADNSDMIAIKISAAQKKTLNFIADELQAKSRSVRRALTTGAGAGGGEKAAAGTAVSGGGPPSRSGVILDALPYFLSFGIRYFMRLLASYYGISFKKLGITPFPHGTCNIITTPRDYSVRSANDGLDSEVGVVMVPEADGMLSSPPVVVTIGGISVKTMLDAERKLTPLRVLNLAVSIDSRAVGFAQGRQFAAILQGFMMDYKDEKE